MTHLYKSSQWLASLTSIVRPVCALSIAFSMAFPVFASDAGDVSALLRSGKAAEAVAKADSLLTAKPRDPQIRFLKGIALSEQGKTSEAIAVFTKLTEDYPELPEPYNNLAVLFAGSAQYDKARAALEMAIRTNPSYATAHENLGDVYAKLASQSYDKALQLDNNNRGAKTKLTLIRDLVSYNTGTTKRAESKSDNKNTAVLAQATSAKKSDVAATTAPVNSAKNSTKNASQTVMQDENKRSLVKSETKTDAKLAKVVEATPATPQNVSVVKKHKENKPEVLEANKPESSKVEANKLAVTEDKTTKKVQAEQTASLSGQQQEVLDAVNQWAKAWSQQDVKAYLANYSSDFQTPDGQSRKNWEESRRQRIAGKKNISVQVAKPRVSVDGQQATVKFHQQYASDRLSVSTRKTLVLVKKDGQWLIQQEQAN